MHGLPLKFTHGRHPDSLLVAAGRPFIHPSLGVAREMFVSGFAADAELFAQIGQRLLVIAIPGLSATNHSIQTEVSCSGALDPTRVKLTQRYSYVDREER